MMIGLGIGLTMRQNVRARSVLSTLGASAAFAAGPRRLTDSYSGPAMRVRRSSDNVAADIGFTAVGDLDTFALMNHVGAENQLLWSEDFTQAYWSKFSGALITTGVADPFGGANAQTVTFGSSATSAIFNSMSVTSGSYTLSLYIKSATGKKCRLNFYTGTTDVFSADLATTSAWQRFTLTTTNPVTSVSLKNESAGGTGSVDIFGCQFNTGTTAKDYCRTTGAATANGDGFVSKLYDQSGNGRDLAQATAANQPRIVLAGVVDKLNARPAVRTDGVSQYIGNAAFALSQPFTRSSVIQFLSTASVKVLLDSSAAGTSVLYTSAPSVLSMSSGATLTLKTGFAANDTATVIEVYNGVSSLGSYNGNVVSGPAGAVNQTQLTIGAEGNGTVQANALFGDVILFPTALSTNDRQSLEANQKAYYGTP